MAQTKPASSRAMATITLFRGKRRAESRPNRAQSRSCAFQATSHARFDALTWRRAMTQETRAGCA
jgi:hypothetical protein